MNHNVLTIEKDTINAYETRTGFFGLGAFLESKNRIKIIDYEVFPDE